MAYAPGEKDDLVVKAREWDLGDLGSVSETDFLCDSGQVTYFKCSFTSVTGGL